MEAVKSNIVETIQQNPVVVYAKNTCPYCIATQDRLNKLGAKYKWVEIKNKEGADIQTVFNSEDLFGEASELEEQYGLKLKNYQRTVPNIWIGKEQIGGCSDLNNLSDDQVLEKIKAAEAS